MNPDAVPAYLQKVAHTQAYRRYAGRRKRLVLGLTAFHLGLILIFDLSAVYAPGLMAAPAWQGSALTAGMAAALAIVISVIVAVFYYSYRVDRELLQLQKHLPAHPRHG
jgi:uncharacterized membrane protein (DUF485 family)